MNAETVFSIANIFALAGWLILIVMGRHRWVHTLLTGAILPLLLSALYTAMLVTHWGEAEGGFGSLAGVQALFSNQWLLLAGWVHYLAFDLFVGSWEVRDAQQHRIPHWAMIPCLIPTIGFYNVLNSGNANLENQPLKLNAVTLTRTDLITFQ